ncbi:MAG: hypothetical protein AB1352_00255 [Patescibacteria group bacterium]
MPTKPKLLLYLEGTILDDRAILYLKVTKHDSGYLRRLGESLPVEGAVEFCKAMQERFDLVYLGHRGEEQRVVYSEWLQKHGFPEGELIVGGYKAKLPQGIAYAIDNRVQDAEDVYPKLGITYIPVNEYGARWEKVRVKIANFKSQIADNT